MARIPSRRVLGGLITACYQLFAHVHATTAAPDSEDTPRVNIPGNDVFRVHVQETPSTAMPRHLDQALEDALIALLTVHELPEHARR